jgi:hypothetical protein
MLSVGKFLSATGLVSPCRKAAKRVRLRVFQFGCPTVWPELPEESLDLALGPALDRLQGGIATGLRDIVGDASVAQAS